MNEPRNINQNIGKILVMEEEDSLRRLIKGILIKKGFEVECTKDGAEAVRLYKTAHAMQQPFDAVILDLTVTLGIGAKGAIKQLIEIDPNVKGIVLSGDIFNEAMVNPRKFGFCGSIKKPFTRNELITTVNETIKNR